MSVKKLPGLNGLRGIAALLVLAGHVYQIAGLYGDAASTAFFDKRNVGGDMVNLFFVISGFIISYLLLDEKKRTSTISLRNFYIKRILRIWPLYFFLFVAVLLVTTTTNIYSPLGGFTKGSIFLVLLFIVQFNYYFNCPLSTIPHYWSLSVEEQFYLFWPFLLRNFALLRVAMGTIVLLLLARNGAAYLSSHHHYGGFWYHANQVLIDTKFDSMAIGALGAFYFGSIKRHASVIFHPILQIAAWLVFAGSIVHKIYVPYVYSDAMAALYLYLILCVTAGRTPMISLRQRFFEWAGSISYGIYMYHWPLVPIIILCFKKLNVWDASERYFQIPLLVVSYVLTCGVAHFSFYFFESKFLKLRPGKIIADKQLVAKTKFI